MLHSLVYRPLQSAIRLAAHQHGCTSCDLSPVCSSLLQKRGVLLTFSTFRTILTYAYGP
jgi:hypothetical protein